MLTTTGAAMQIIPTIDAAVTADILLDRCNYHAPKSLKYSNMETFNRIFALHLEATAYNERTCHIEPISLIGLAKGTTVFGGGNFLAGSPTHLLLEQIESRLVKEPDKIDAVLSQPRETLHVNEECLLAARYGEGTWGHWLVDILPKIVIAEHFYPGRFRFLLPIDVLGVAERRNVWTSIRESLKAYKIDLRCIQPLHAAYNYTFDRLFSLTSIRSDFVIHPAAAELMRSVALTGKDKRKRIAILRRDSPVRNISNIDEVINLLERRGFDFFETGLMTFEDQLSAFQSGTTIVGVLGSGLTGILYSPFAVKVASLAPSDFGDRFFYGLIQNRNGSYADVRGQIDVPSAVHTFRDSSFTIDIQALNAALDAI